MAQAEGLGLFVKGGPCSSLPLLKKPSIPWWAWLVKKESFKGLACAVLGCDGGTNLVGMIVFYVLITARSWKLTGKDMRNFFFYISIIALPEWTLLLNKKSYFSPSLLRQWQIEFLYERHKCLRSALLSPSSKVSAWLPPQKERAERA